MKMVVDSKYTSLADELRQLPQRMARGEGDVIYRGRNVVARFRVGRLTVLVKRFKRVNVVRGMVYTFFRRSKAERAYAFADEFSRRGISTPQRVAYMEERRWGFFAVGYYVSLEADGIGAHLLLREVEHFSPELADAVAAHVVLMHSRGVLHGDLNLSNFLCTDADGWRFTMIDINRSHFTQGWPTDSQCMDNLKRITHRRDLYDHLLRSFARERGWDEDATVAKGLELLNAFERRKHLF